MPDTRSKSSISSLTVFLGVPAQTYSEERCPKSCDLLHLEERNIKALSLLTGEKTEHKDRATPLDETCVVKTVKKLNECVHWLIQVYFRLFFVNNRN